MFIWREVCRWKFLPWVLPIHYKYTYEILKGKSVQLNVTWWLSAQYLGTSVCMWLSIPLQACLSMQIYIHEVLNKWINCFSRSKFAPFSFSAAEQLVTPTITLLMDFNWFVSFRSLNEFRLILITKDNFFIVWVIKLRVQSFDPIS